MDKKKFNLILDRLLQRTKEGKLEWEKTADVLTYLIVLENSAVSMSLLPSIDALNFQFRNENGDVVESAIIDDTVAPQAYSLFYLVAEKLNENENAEKTVNSILEQLAA